MGDLLYFPGKWPKKGQDVGGILEDPEEGDYSAPGYLEPNEQQYLLHRAEQIAQPIGTAAFEKVFINNHVPTHEDLSRLGARSIDSIARAELPNGGQESLAQLWQRWGEWRLGVKQAGALLNHYRDIQSGRIVEFPEQDGRADFHVPESRAA